MLCCVTLFANDEELLVALSFFFYLECSQRTLVGRSKYNWK